MQLLQLQQWLTPHMWSLQTLNANPYDYNPAGALTCHGGVGFRIEWGAYAACAPCDALTMQTSDTCAVMKDAVSTFSGCSGTAPDTVQTVCGSCKAFAGSNLIPKNNVDGNPNAAYLAFPLPSLTTGSQLSWPCRYTCPSGTYINTYNNNNYDNYVGELATQGPCLPCPAAGTPPAVCAAKQYLDSALLSCSGGAYVPPCRNCVTNIAHVIFVGTNYSATGATGCLATCQQGYYHTLLLRGGYAAAPVALGEIRDCQPCTDNLTIPCGGFCSASFYLSRNTSTCLPCSSAQCPLGTYRGPCASDADAPCLPCAPLNNSISALQRAAPSKAAWLQAMVFSQLTHGSTECDAEGHVLTLIMCRPQQPARASRAGSPGCRPTPTTPPRRGSYAPPAPPATTPPSAAGRARTTTCRSTRPRASTRSAQARPL